MSSAKKYLIPILLVCSTIQLDARYLYARTEGEVPPAVESKAPPAEEKKLTRKEKIKRSLQLVAAELKTNAKNLLKENEYNSPGIMIAAKREDQEGNTVPVGVVWDFGYIGAGDHKKPFKSEEGKIWVILLGQAVPIKLAPYTELLGNLFVEPGMQRAIKGLAVMHPGHQFGIRIVQLFVTAARNTKSNKKNFPKNKGKWAHPTVGEIPLEMLKLYNRLVLTYPDLKPSEMIKKVSPPLHDFLKKLKVVEPLMDTMDLFYRQFEVIKSMPFQGDTTYNEKEPTHISEYSGRLTEDQMKILAAAIGYRSYLEEFPLAKVEYGGTEEGMKKLRLIDEAKVAFMKKREEKAPPKEQAEAYKKWAKGQAAAYKKWKAADINYKRGIAKHPIMFPGAKTKYSILDFLMRETARLIVRMPDFETKYEPMILPWVNPIFEGMGVDWNTVKLIAQKRPVEELPEGYGKSSGKGAVAPDVPGGGLFPGGDDDEAFEGLDDEELELDELA